jgi:DNA replication protein DnaC
MSSRDQNMFYNRHESHRPLSASLADNSFITSMKTFTSPRLLIIDELGYLPVDKQGGRTPLADHLHPL